jgi:hypothetical protein
MTKQNFLLGKGERLVEEVAGVRGGGPKSHPYTFTEAKARISPMLARVVRGIDHLPDAACPNDRAVATITLNPEYIAKSYFPDKLFEAIGLETVGSRPRRIKPEKRSKGRDPEEAITTELFVMGPRSAFRAWREGLSDWQQNGVGAKELPTIEEVSAPTARDKIKGRLPKSGNVVFEVVLHSDAGAGANGVIPQFKQYLRGIGIDQPLDRRFAAGGLCFVEVEAPAKLADRIATFTPVRALRQMPTLRILRPSFRSSRVPMEEIEFPKAGPDRSEYPRRHLRWRHPEGPPHHQVGEADRTARHRQPSRRIPEARGGRDLRVLVRPYRSGQAARAPVCLGRSLPRARHNPGAGFSRTV